MGKDPGFDTALAHRYFAADCFNKTWEFIEKPNRTRDEDEQMIRLAQASLWHWTHRADCKDMQLSIGHWLLARVQALAGRVEEARRHADQCLQHSQGETPFHLAYAYEALARAEKVAGNTSLTAKYKAEAVRLAETIEDAEDRKLLIDDLASI
jgi:hypothetical protein